jgi:hypothetical protein
LFLGAAAGNASGIIAAGEPSGGGDGGISGGAIAGIVIGVLAAIALLAIGMWFWLRRRRAKRGDLELAQKHHESPISAAGVGNKGALRELLSARWQSTLAQSAHVATADAHAWAVNMMGWRACSDLHA